METERELVLYLPSRYSVVSDTPVFKKHLLTADLVSEAGLAKIKSGRPARTEEMLPFHSETYLHALETGSPDDLASSGYTWFPGLYDIMESVVGSFLDAIDRAKQHSVSGSLGGCGHHAGPERGGALSPVNTVGIGVHYARHYYKRVFVLDLDMHFGNGTTAGFPNDPELFLFDYHGHASGFFEPETPHLFRNLISTPDGATYLRFLKKELPLALDRFEPECCLYVAGMDVFSGTSRAHLLLGAKDIEHRERFVFAQLAARNIPVAYVHGGAYTTEETAAKLYLIAAREAQRALQQQAPVGSNAGGS